MVIPCFDIGYFWGVKPLWKKKSGYYIYFILVILGELGIFLWFPPVWIYPDNSTQSTGPISVRSGTQMYTGYLIIKLYQLGKFFFKIISVKQKNVTHIFLPFASITQSIHLTVSLVLYTCDTQSDDGRLFWIQMLRDIKTLKQIASRTMYGRGSREGSRKHMASVSAQFTVSYVQGKYDIWIGSGGEGGGLRCG